MSERDISARLTALGLVATAAGLDDIVAMATKKRWSPVQLLEHVLSLEEQDRSRRGLDRRLKRSRLERFKPMADFDWNGPPRSTAPSSSPLFASTSSKAHATSCSSHPKDWARP